MDYNDTVLHNKLRQGNFTKKTQTRRCDAVKSSLEMQPSNVLTEGGSRFNFNVFTAATRNALSPSVLNGSKELYIAEKQQWPIQAVANAENKNKCGNLVKTPSSQTCISNGAVPRTTVRRK